jgi:hypothetical protein
MSYAKGYLVDKLDIIGMKVRFMQSKKETELIIKLNLLEKSMG